MGFRFRKSIKLFPGVRINLSATGVSASIGKPGATVNISERGTRGTVGIPGTGISYSEKLSGSTQHEPTVQADSKGSGVGTLVVWGIIILVVVMVFSR